MLSTGLTGSWMGLAWSSIAHHHQLGEHDDAGFLRPPRAQPGSTRQILANHSPLLFIKDVRWCCMKRKHSFLTLDVVSWLVFVSSLPLPSFPAFEIGSGCECERMFFTGWFWGKEVPRHYWTSNCGHFCLQFEKQKWPQFWDGFTPKGFGGQIHSALKPSNLWSRANYI